jgi:hypothetical protein
MLPDLDSDSGVPVREMLALIAAVTPVVMMPRLRLLGLQHEHLVLAVVVLYLAVRFGIGELFRHYTIHRGMWHSLPAAAIVGLLAFLLCSADTLHLRLFKSGAFVLGFITHLVMDELWSVYLRGLVPRVKSSFGSALKVWTNKSVWANISTYGKLAALVVLVIGDPYLMRQLGVDQGDLPKSPQEWVANAKDLGRRAVSTLWHRTQAILARTKFTEANLPDTATSAPAEPNYGWRLPAPVAVPDASAPAYGASPPAETAQGYRPLPEGDYFNPSPAYAPAAPLESARRPAYDPGRR